MAEEAEDPHEEIVEEGALAPEEVADHELDAAPQDQSPSDLETLAREMGWSPESEWRGPKDAWKDAKTFLKTTVDINRNLSKDVRDLRDTVDRMARTSASLADKAAKEAREQAIEEFNSAVASGDAEAALEASRKLDEVRSPQRDDAVSDFVTRNAAWYSRDEEATAYAQSVAQIWANKGHDASRQVQEAEAAVRKRFPELFDEPGERQQTQRRSPPVVQGGQRTTGAAPRKKGIADLPPDARRAAEDYARRGRCTVEEYAQVYFAENG